ncbi:Asr1405/Asl0597 family protein [Floridanema evergladense]|uniref:Asr1405/Asl0597 family protein n=1 Tax=Floridaenema evergladense BLCC-F167 TaxID=3153639 RepID=A0ABV4WV22_9CYAN
MEQSSVNSIDSQVVAVCRCDRWQVYHRLQALDIPCCCNGNGRLEVEINSPLAAIQLWCVVKQLTAPRSELVAQLNRCWELKS